MNEPKPIEPTKDAVRSSEWLAAAELCESLAEKRNLLTADMSGPYEERVKAHMERISLWEAAAVIRREAANDQALPEGGANQQSK